MGRRVESILFKGFVDKGLRVSYIFTLELEGKTKIISESNNGDIKIYPGYILCIGAIYPGPRIFVSSSKFFTFTVLLEKSIKLIQENLFELFPNVGSVEFDINERVLERFQKEKALSSANVTMMPSIYTDSTGTCSPGLRISLDDKGSSITVPLEDAIGMNQMFKTFDPNLYGLNILSQLIKIE